jgi:gliding-associated putative ABC transporter substrate-binding component GldG
MKPKRLGSNIVAEVVVVVAIIALINLISLRFFSRADLTEGNLYSISESTKQVVRDLDDIVNVKVYFSKKLPPYLATLTRGVRDVLDEYRAYAGKNLIVDFEDPADDPELEQRVRALGIPQVQLNIIEKDKAEVMNGYLGIAVMHADRNEVIPVVQSSANLEYELTSAILKVSGEEKTVAFIADPEDAVINPAYELVTRSLEKQYAVRPVTTVDPTGIPMSINTLVVAGPRNLGAWDAFVIDQFIMHGGRVVFLVDGIEVPEQSLFAAKTQTGLDSLLAHYGVRVKQDMVIDRSAGSATFSTGFMRYTLPYPLWPRITRNGFNQDSPITSQLETAVFPWTSSIDTLAGRPGGIEATVLASSSVQSWTEEGRFDLNPQRDFTPATQVAPRNLVVLLSGRFTSFYSGRPVPDPGQEGLVWEGEKLDQSPETQILVVGNSRFIGSDFMAQYPENRTLFLNAVDWLTLGDSLIGIRSRVVTARPLKEIGEGAKGAIRFASTFGIPIVLIVWGLLRRYLRSVRGGRLSY